MKIGQLFINNALVDAKNSFKHINPNNNEEFATVAKANEEEVNLAVEAASKAFIHWSNMTIKERASIIQKAADILIEMYGEEGQETELKLLISNEVGKRLPEADIEVIESSDMIAYYAENAEKLLSDRELSLNQELWASKKSIVKHIPIGVIGVIKAWNYPLEIPIWTLAPALIAGNTIVFKPSEYSSFVGLEIGEIFKKAGLPDGVLNIITGDGKTGEYLVKNKTIRMIDFTGSVETGRKIAIECANSLKKYNLELGGNDAAIVCDDANLELTANGLVWGSFCNSGQVCVGIKRVFIDKKIKDILIDKVLDKTSSLIPTQDYGPIISEEQITNIESFINDAVNKGAKILTGGKRIDKQSGLYFQPTVLTNITKDMKIMKEECFGPLLPIVFVDNIEEAIAMANDSNYGLGASIWTSNIEKGLELSNEIQSGMVWINDVNVAFPEAPWGGIKNSGIGIALSDQAIYEYIEYKHISIEQSEEQRRIWWYPYS